MTEIGEQAIVALLYEQVTLLREMRDLLAVQLVESAPIDGCVHPEDSRVDFSTPGDPHHWVCGLCRYDNKAPVDTMN